MKGETNMKSDGAAWGTHRSTSAFWLGAAALLLGALGCAGCQTKPQARATAYIASGKRYVARGKFRDAAIQFRNALQQDPKNWRARYQLASVENQMQDWRQCYQDLLEVVTEQPSFAPARLDLAELYIAADQYDMAQHQLDEVRRLSPKNVRAEMVQMKLYLTRGDLDSAAKQCVGLKHLARDDAEAYALCGLADLGEKKYQQAQKSFQGALHLDPGNVENYRNLSNVLDLEGKTDQAEELLESGILRNPKSLDLQLCLADLYVRHGRLQDVDKLFANLEAKQAQFPNLLVRLGNFWMWRNELPRAIAEYQAAETNHPSELTETNLASAYLTLHQVAKARQFTSEVVRRDPDGADGKALEGALDYLKGDYADAARLLQASRKENPGSLLTNFYLGMTWLASGQRERATQAFGDCVQENEQFAEAYARLGQIALESGDWRLGAEYAKRVLSIHPGAIDGYLLLAQADIMQGNFQSAGKIIAVAERAFPGSQAMQQVAIRFDILQKNFDQAGRQFAQVAGKSSHPFALLDWYAKQLVAAGEIPRAIDDVRARMNHAPADSDTSELLGWLYFKEGNLDKAESFARQSVGEDRGSAMAWQLLGEILERQGKTAEADHAYTSAIRSNPNDVQAYLLAGNLFMQEGKYAQAESYFESARLRAPQSDAAKLALIHCWAAQDAHLNQSLGVAQALKVKYPHNPSVNDALGWIYHERGLDTLALPELEMAAQARPLDADIQFHLGVTLMGQIHKSRARRKLALALKLGLPPKEQVIAEQELASAKTTDRR